MNIYHSASLCCDFLFVDEQHFLQKKDSIYVFVSTTIRLSHLCNKTSNPGDGNLVSKLRAGNLNEGEMAFWKVIKRFPRRFLVWARVRHRAGETWRSEGC